MSRNEGNRAVPFVADRTYRLSMLLVLLQDRAPTNPTGYGVAVSAFGQPAHEAHLVIEDGDGVLRLRPAKDIFAQLPIKGDNFHTANSCLRILQVVKAVPQGCSARQGHLVPGGTRGIAVNARLLGTGHPLLEVLVCWNDRFTSLTPLSFHPQHWTGALTTPTRSLPPSPPRPAAPAMPADAPKSVAYLINCPGCSTTLRLRRVGPRALVHCPACKAAFFAEPAGHQLEIRFRDPVVRPAEDPRPPHVQLGVQPGADAEEVKRAWRQRVKLYHPDNFHHLGPDFVALATDHTRRINSAYDKLKE
jgi:hypothetical protein